MSKWTTAKDVLRRSGVRGVGRLAIRKLAQLEQQGQINITDEYVTWLGYANAGMLNPGNLYCFDYAIRNLPSDKPILEIGSFCGLSTNAITHYLRKHQKANQFFTCDRWEFENKQGKPTLGDTDISHVEYRTFVKDSYLRNARMFSRDRLPSTIEVFSDEFFELWRAGKTMTDVFGREVTLGGMFSFCYIDGDHTYAFAQRDFENCDAHLEIGGFVFFDDSMDGSTWEVCQVVAEIQRSGRYELIARNPNYLFRKIA